MNLNIEYDEIIEIEFLDEEYDRYDLEIEKYHSFFANGILVHNCRCIATKNGLFTRNWKPIISVPHIFEQLKPILEEGYVLDGELYNHELKHDFNKIMSLVRKTKPTPEDLEESASKIQYWVFDVIDNTDKFSDRYETLLSLKKEYHIPDVIITPTVYCDTQEKIDGHYQEYLNSGYEGQMIRYDSTYENRRSSSLLKRKTFVDEEFRILSVEEGNGNWSGFAKRILCRDEENGLEFTATLKNNQTWCKQVLDEREIYMGGVVTVRYQNKTPDGIPRFPIAVAIYPGERTL